MEETEPEPTLFALDRYLYRAWFTNLSLTPAGVWNFYEGRAGMELRIRELREDYALRTGTVRGPVVPARCAHRLKGASRHCQPSPGVGLRCWSGMGLVLVWCWPEVDTVLINRTGPQVKLCDHHLSAVVFHTNAPPLQLLAAPAGLL
jgi:hypothetical protein